MRLQHRLSRMGLAVVAAGSLSVGAGAPASAAADQETFASPEAAVAALDAAWQNGRTSALRLIFGAAGDKLVRSGDRVAEKQARERFAASFAQAHHIELDDGRAVLVIGDDQWPYPIPLVRRGSAWVFDIAAGQDQIIDRRIGRNELAAIQTCRAYVQAQRDFAARNSRSHEFATKVESSPGAQDGLYWPATAGTEESPLGPLVASAEARGYGVPNGEGAAPFQGYYYRILTAQGPHASGGAKSYLVGGHMTGGFALVAFPAKYGRSGVMTFIVNQSGIVFERNLGPDTDAIARRMTGFDPSGRWKIADVRS